MLFKQIESLKSSLSGDRAEALEQFLSLGFPTTKNEEYKYTDLSEVINKEYSFSPKENFHITKEQLDKLHLGEEYFDFIVFVNGKFQKAVQKGLLVKVSTLDVQVVNLLHEQVLLAHQ